MIKKNLLIPALLGLGLYSQHGEVNLCNNTTMLLLIFVLLEDHAKIEELECCCKCSECGGHEHFDRRSRKNDCHCGCNCF